MCVEGINIVNWDSEMPHEDLSQEWVRTSKLKRRAAQTEVLSDLKAATEWKKRK